MQIFKIYFKIIKANLGQIIMYLAIFMTMAMIFSFSASSDNKDSFSQTKAKAALINLDKNTYLINGLKEYMSKYVDYVDIENKPEKLQDALFYRDVEYIITIPENFTSDFLSGKIPKVEKTTVPNSAAGMYIDMTLNKYLNALRVYSNNIPGITEEELVSKAADNTAENIQVSVKNFENKKNNTAYAVNYFNYLAYVLLAMLILGVSSNLMVFNNKNLKRRNLCSPMKNKTFNAQLIAANLAFGFICYSVITVFAFILNRKNMLNYGGALLCLNGLIYTVVALSISYLVGILIKSRSIQSAVSNILALGLSFPTGVFVPQELLSSKTLAVASCTPTYWFVKANNVIGTLSSVSLNTLSPILMYMLIQLVFAAAIFSVALVINKQKRIANS